MVRRFGSLGAGMVGLVVIAVLAVGMAVPVSAFAAAKRPVVSSISPSSGVATGGVRVAITGKHFRVNGRSVVKHVTFGGQAATRIRVKSANLIKVTAPAGTGRVNVRVTTRAGTSARVVADRFTYVGPATQMSHRAGDNQTASAGAPVSIAPSVIVKDARGRPVPGVSVTFEVATGGGSVTGSFARTDASGVAAVGSWRLGAVAGANTLTAVSSGLSGSPVTFTATGDAGVLAVRLNGNPVRSYSLTDLRALPAFSGYAGTRNNAGTVTGPDAVTGAKVTDILTSALGTPLTGAQSVEVTSTVPPALTKIFTYDKLVNFTGFSLYTAPGGTPVAIADLTGPLASVLIYDDPAGLVMPANRGPLRFFVADAAASDNMVMSSSDSVGTVDVLNVINP